MSLKNKAISGTKWATVSSLISAVLQLVQTVLLTRYLDKSSMGLMALATTVIGVSQVFVDLGLSNAIIQKQDISKIQLSTLYWLNIVLGFSIYILLWLSSGLIANYYEEPRLNGILHWIGFSFLIQPVSQQYEILLQKRLMFKPIAISVFVSRVIGFGVCVILLHYEFGVYSIVYANIVVAFVNCLTILKFGGALYRPSFCFSIKSISKDGFLSFGLYQMGAKIIFILATQFDVFFIGKLLGMKELGVYNVAKVLSGKTLELVNAIFGKVSFPLFSRLQSHKHLLNKAYFEILSLKIIIIAPVFTMIAIFARPLIEILFSNKWLEAEAPLMWLSLAGFTGCIWHTIAILLLSVGKAKQDMLGNSFLVILVPISVYIGAPYGIEGVALAIGMTRVLML